MNNLLISDFLTTKGMTETMANFIGIAATIILILLFAYVSYWITKRYMVHVIEIVFNAARTPGTTPLSTMVLSGGFPCSCLS